MATSLPIKNRTMILWAISGVALLTLRALPAIGADSGTTTVLSSCKATENRHQFDGKIITVSGRFGFGPSGSNDAPVLLRDLLPCDVKDADRALLADTSHLNPGPATDHFRALQNDLIPACKPHKKCYPDKVARHIYADIVVRGRFHIVNENRRPMTFYCCSIDIEDVLSVEVGPETPKPPK